jgi:hypothetical protein
MYDTLFFDDGAEDKGTLAERPALSLAALDGIGYDFLENNFVVR